MARHSEHARQLRQGGRLPGLRARQALEERDNAVDLRVGESGGLEDRRLARIRVATTGHVAHGVLQRAGAAVVASTAHRAPPSDGVLNAPRSASFFVTLKRPGSGFSLPCSRPMLKNVLLP